MISEERIKEILTPVFIRQDQASIHWPDIFEEVRAIEAEVRKEFAQLISEQNKLNKERQEWALKNSETIIALALQNKQMRKALKLLI